MALFTVPKRPGREQDKAIAGKSKSRTRATTTVKGSGLLGQINQIKATVETHLGKFKGRYAITTSVDMLRGYFNRACCNGVIAIDTETTGLDPLTDKIVGLCIYTPDMLPAYVPINHVSYVTGKSRKSAYRRTGS